MINKIKCSECGTLKSVNRDVLVKRIVKFGSLEEVLNNYRCASCRKADAAFDLDAAADKLREEIAAKKAATIAAGA